MIILSMIIFHYRHHWHLVIPEPCCRSNQRERVAHAGNRFAVDQHVGGAGNNRRGWESLVVCSQATQQHNFLAHSFAPSFLEESSIDFRGRHWHPVLHDKQRLTETQPKSWQTIQTVACPCSIRRVHVRFEAEAQHRECSSRRQV